MIIGIGIDSVEIARFALWHNYPEKTLSRIFSTSEIEYCLGKNTLCAQRFAIRFAAREALYKALSQYDPSHTIPLLTLCAATKITYNKKAPEISIDWEKIKQYCTQPVDNITSLLSMTHSQSIATAITLLQKPPNASIF